MKKVVFALILCLAFAYNATAQRIVCDDTCKLEYLEPGEQPLQQPGQINYAVVSPVGIGTVEMITQAPRLQTLDGKTIALVGGSFMASVTHPEIKNLLEENYSNVTVLMFDQVGAAGVYPAPGVTRKSKEEFQDNLRKLHIDAVITGNCGCGLCTPKEVGSLIAAEYVGVPAVAIAGPGFVDEVYYTSRNNGIPAPRVAEYPGAFATHTREQLLDNTRNVLWPQIVEALTTQITAQEIDANAQRSSGDIRDDVFYGTIDQVNDHFVQMRWSDGLPIVPPTFEAVSAFLEHTHMDWDQTVATLPVAHRNTTVWHVAVNGVMAGCKPEYMPVLIAITKALGAPEFRRTIASTHGWTPFCWINGPMALDLGISCGDGEISQPANVAIGRFMNLALMNLCGYYVGSNRMGTFGYPMCWCFAEDEQACARVGWEPYHVRQGYAPDKSTVTVGSALIWGNNMAPSTTDAQKIMELMAWDISERCQFALGSGTQYTYRTVLITEPVAAVLAGKYADPGKLEQDLIRNSRRPLKERVFANYYANPGSAPEQKHPLRHWEGHLRKTEHAITTKTPAWYDSPESTMETVATMREKMTAFIITGDSSRNKIQIMPGGGYATVEIER